MKSALSVIPMGRSFHSGVQEIGRRRKEVSPDTNSSPEQSYGRTLIPSGPFRQQRSRAKALGTCRTESRPNRELNDVTQGVHG